MDPDRCARAAVALNDGAIVTPAEDGTYRVESFTGDGEYLVDLDRRTCSCPDAAFRGETCKHVLAVALARGLS